MKNKFIYLFSLLGLGGLVCVFALAQTNKEQNVSNVPVEIEQGNRTSTQSNYKPKDGYVPDQETAIAIAVAVWNPIYGKEKIKSEKPYKASLKDGVWTVTGTLHYQVGGVALAEISKDDGRILRIIHGK